LRTVDVAVVAVLVVALGVAALAFSIRLVGRIAVEFGEDPARWQILMLPFALLGPLVARVILSRRNGRGGRGGGYA
jgi:hypothetical protein